jgi:hypothetical protein
MTKKDAGSCETQHIISKKCRHHTFLCSCPSACSIKSVRRAWTSAESPAAASMARIARATPCSRRTPASISEFLYHPIYFHIEVIYDMAYLGVKKAISSNTFLYDSLSTKSILMFLYRYDIAI